MAEQTISTFISVEDSVRITWKPEYAGPANLFSFPHMANAVAEYLGTEGPHTYFSVIRLMIEGRRYCETGRPSISPRRRMPWRVVG